MDRYSILREGGLSVVHGYDGPVLHPYAATIPTATWWSPEGSNMPTTGASFGQVGVAPKFCVAFLPVSRQLLLQSAAETVLRALMAEAIARAIDAAVIAGAGVLGAPQGVLYTSGIGTQSGASLGSAGLRTMRKTVLLAGAREDKLRRSFSSSGARRRRMPRLMRARESAAYMLYM